MGRFTNNIECKDLEWDTKYFNIISSKIILKEQVTYDDLFEVKNQVQNSEFVTIINNDNNPANNFLITSCFEKNCFLTDFNISFINSNFQEEKYDNCYIYNDSFSIDKIFEIAKNNFVFSRFFNDPFLDANRKKNIYVHWVDSARNDDGRSILVYAIENDVMGFIVYRIGDSECTIELIAVEKNCQGKKIGTNLMNCLKSICFSKKLKKIYVGTQGCNINAINFYTSCGFKLFKCNSIYHYWPNK